ncbi:baseplate assembly protein [Plesiomonas shigelloides]|uniref:Baseplate J-like protein n=1 Tax=Plesiomonas shigelloides 302-73 TaxID=1315976 RepID=R8AR66_PLESH|nr:baseplate J/gp47 family protein [Plesiomonas shigelloides]EON88814.1 baseplate J-like protein [Plesiomonas shigelloides 302-73]
MFNPAIDRIPVPQALQYEPFSQKYPRLKQAFLQCLTAIRPEDVTAVEQTLENDAEILTILLQYLTEVMVFEDRKRNKQFESLLMLFAKGDSLDARAADFGVFRQTLKKGNPNAYPPQPDEMESDRDLLIRALLAPFGFGTTGSRTAYRFHAMTLGERPTISVEKPQANEVVLRYRFADESPVGKVLDAQARCEAPGTGNVSLYILSRETAEGIPSESLLKEVATYLSRDDIELETDVLSVKAPTITHYKIHAKLYGRPTPDGLIDIEPVTAALQEYAQATHRLSGRVDLSMLYFTLQQAQRVVRVELSEPAASIVCDYKTAPYCTGIELEVAYE